MKKHNYSSFDFLGNNAAMPHERARMPPIAYGPIVDQKPAGSDSSLHILIRLRRLRHSTSFANKAVSTMDNSQSPITTKIMKVTILGRVIADK